MITDIKETPGYTPVPTQNNQQASQNAGDVPPPPPQSSGGLAPRVSQVVPGETLPVPASNLTPDNADTSAIANIGDALGNLLGAATEEPAVVEADVMETPDVPPPSSGGVTVLRQSTLQSMAPEAYSSIQRIEPTSSSPVTALDQPNGRGYTSVLPMMVSPGAKSQPQPQSQSQSQAARPPVSGNIPEAPSGGQLSVEGFVNPSTNTTDIVSGVHDRYAGKRLPASLRLNNMGGISITGSSSKISESWAARQPGFVGVVKRPANEGGWYAQYATPEDGVRAASQLLIRYGDQGVDTPSKIANKWAVGGLDTYINTTTRYLREAGFDVNKNTKLDLNNPAVRKALVMAKSAHESGFGKPVYTNDVFNRAIGS